MGVSLAGKIVAKTWEFSSSSNPNVHYETIQYTDDYISCSCPGWTRRVAADGNRSCKHTRMIDMGSADREATASHDYTRSGTKAVATKATPLAATKATKNDHTVAPVRKVLWSKNG